MRAHSLFARSKDDRLRVSRSNLLSSFLVSSPPMSDSHNNAMIMGDDHQVSVSALMLVCYVKSMMIHL